MQTALRPAVFEVLDSGPRDMTGAIEDAQQLLASAPVSPFLSEEFDAIRHAAQLITSGVASGTTADGDPSGLAAVAGDIRTAIERLLASGLPLLLHRINLVSPLREHLPEIHRSVHGLLRSIGDGSADPGAQGASLLGLGPFWADARAAAGDLTLLASATDIAGHLAHGSRLFAGLQDACLALHRSLAGSTHPDAEGLPDLAPEFLLCCQLYADCVTLFRSPVVQDIVSAQADLRSLQTHYQPFLSAIGDGLANRLIGQVCTSHADAQDLLLPRLKCLAFVFCGLSQLGSLFHSLLAALAQPLAYFMKTVHHLTLQVGATAGLAASPGHQYSALVGVWDTLADSFHRICVIEHLLDLLPDDLLPPETLGFSGLLRHAVACCVVFLSAPAWSVPADQLYLLNSRAIASIERSLAANLSAPLPDVVGNLPASFLFAGTSSYPLSAVFWAICHFEMNRTGSGLSRSIEELPAATATSGIGVSSFSSRNPSEARLLGFCQDWIVSSRRFLSRLEDFSAPMASASCPPELLSCIRHIIQDSATAPVVRAVIGHLARKSFTLAAECTASLDALEERAAALSSAPVSPATPDVRDLSSLLPTDALLSDLVSQLIAELRGALGVDIGHSSEVLRASGPLAAPVLPCTSLGSLSLFEGVASASSRCCQLIAARLESTASLLPAVRLPTAPTSASLPPLLQLRIKMAATAFSLRSLLLARLEMVLPGEWESAHGAELAHFRQTLEHTFQDPLALLDSLIFNTLLGPLLLEDATRALLIDGCLHSLALSFHPGHSSHIPSSFSGVSRHIDALSRRVVFLRQTVLAQLPGIGGTPSSSSSGLATAATARAGDTEDFEIFFRWTSMMVDCLADAFVWRLVLAVGDFLGLTCTGAAGSNPQQAGAHAARGGEYGLPESVRVRLADDTARVEALCVDLLCLPPAVTAGTAGNGGPTASVDTRLSPAGLDGRLHSVRGIRVLRAMQSLLFHTPESLHQLISLPVPGSTNGGDTTEPAASPLAYSSAATIPMFSLDPFLLAHFILALCQAKSAPFLVMPHTRCVAGVGPDLLSASRRPGWPVR
ncbi:hypothetical protein, variant 1 [Fonticula alba]|uniref:Uncharacterized protein n=1 Tax=Fonticula alba TaxID=691883 RepID=A0A058Z3H2_FONAL|nr:hypothetical protein, variant 1 [Fonticula alba]KCV68686.1 hypothetical protein, variant 1 [Fonticula alba]|eukprot:XP_009497118.1 hypothetical protein, variant 1 [Fonticula alba]